VLSHLNDIVYRSTFRYFAKNDMVTVWYSGARLGTGGFHFALATARYPLVELIARVERPASPSRSPEVQDRSANDRAAREAFANHFP
jgi:hypothetical protein